MSVSGPLASACMPVVLQSASLSSSGIKMCMLELTLEGCQLFKYDRLLRVLKQICHALMTFKDQEYNSVKCQDVHVSIHMSQGYQCKNTKLRNLQFYRNLGFVQNMDHNAFGFRWEL